MDLEALRASIIKIAIKENMRLCKKTILTTPNTRLAQPGMAKLVANFMKTVLAPINIDAMQTVPIPIRIRVSNTSIKTEIAPKPWIIRLARFIVELP